MCLLYLFETREEVGKSCSQFRIVGFDCRQLFDLTLLSGDLLLLLLESIDQNGGDAIVLDAFDQPLRVVGDEERLDLLDLFCAEAKVADSAVLPGEAYGLQAVDKRQAAVEREQVGLVSQTR